MPMQTRKEWGRAQAPQDSRWHMAGVAQAPEPPGCEGRTGQQAPRATQQKEGRKEAITQSHRSKKQARGNFF